MGYQLAPKNAPNGPIAIPTDTAAIVKAQTHTDTASKRVMVQGEVVRQRGEALDSILNVTEHIAPDSLTADSLTTLVDTLSKTARLYQFEVLRYQTLVDTLRLTHQAERVTLHLQQDVLRDALLDAENRARCTFLGVPCMTRWQAFAVGVGVAVTVLVLR